MARGVAIIGCGLIGHKRAKTLPLGCLKAAVDTNLQRAQQLANPYAGCAALTDYREALSRDDVDTVIVATANHVLATATRDCLLAGKHVLVEKPAARYADELRQLLAIAHEKNSIVKVGFNHRFHPAFIKSRELIDENALGPLMYIRARYGHGGRIGYDKEWRADPKFSGGGELLDQGVHLIDLSRWFLGDFNSVAGHVQTFFWDMPVEDNGFMLLKTPNKQVAFLHASCTEWKNLFCFEIFGRDGKLQIDGLGGSYGTEKLTWYKMLPQMGPPETTSWEYPFEDRSWQREWDHFSACVDANVQPMGSLEDAIATFDVVEKIYMDSSYRDEWVQPLIEGRLSA